MTRLVMAPGRPFPAYSPAVAEFERTADLEPGEDRTHERADSASLVAELNRVKVAFQMRALCAALGMENVRVEVTAEQPSVANPAPGQSGAGQSGSVPFHSATDNDGAQQRVG